MLGALVERGDAEGDPISLIDALLERHELLEKSVQRDLLPLLQRERRILEELREVISALLASRESDAQAGKKDRVEQSSSLVIMEVVKDFDGGEFGLLKKGDIVAMPKEKAERQKNDAFRLVGDLR